MGSLPPALQTLLNPALVAPAGSSAPVLDLVIASQDGTSPPVDVNLLGLVVTTSNIDAHLSAVTGDGQILGNLLYNVANLANPNGAERPAGPAQRPRLGQPQLDRRVRGRQPVRHDPGPAAAPPDPAQPAQPRTCSAWRSSTDPIIVTLSTQGGDGKLLGNLLGAISTLVNFPGVEAALNNALGTVVNLVNSVDLSLPPGAVGSGAFDTGHRRDHPGPRRVRGPGPPGPARPGGHHRARST